MLLLKLVNETDSEVVYNYFPEKAEVNGSVTISKITGEIIGAQIADNDSHRRYLHHAVSKVIEFYENAEYKNEIVVAWY